ncbi:MAG: DUF3365 domain-containing protein [Proteobacteria bacterium]|nr:DUF3365 domain-containing protein [Pseudomonadota bacterium]MBU1389528.1 DUF3365 domain-containing protein [Pseudomonadota bacterium]MBU1544392.1 DUF3365 domain-containing protein [Pseudomonadota bacterium]MBU2482427.1 DUF3365 domain-containing protein [Pseudomonadota bacterium]
MKKNKPIKKNMSTALWYYGLAGIIFWTVLVCVSVFWHQKAMHLGAVDAARIEAREAFQNHITYRSWNADHGGVYVPVTEHTPPNPYLDVPERDIQTPSGVRLTKLNPAYMTRQITELGFKKFGYISHITSLNPIRPENKADVWETAALKQFEKGIEEITSIETIDQKEYMRLMKPLITEKSCLECHKEQGYKVGDIRGGISVAVPMDAHYSIEIQNKRHFMLMYFLLWLIGVFGSLFFMFALNQQEKKRIQVEEELRKRDKLAGVIEMARAVCHELNQPLQTIMGNTEILMMEDVDKPTIKKRILQIKDQVDRMGKMTRKIIEIANYETKDLPQGKVIDIEKSSKPLESFNKKE